MSCGVGRRCVSDPALLWLWYRPAATAPIRPLAREPPYAASSALEKMKKDQKKTKCFILLYVSICQSFIPDNNILLEKPFHLWYKNERYCNIPLVYMTSPLVKILELEKLMFKSLLRHLKSCIARIFLFVLTFPIWNGDDKIYLTDGLGFFFFWLHLQHMEVPGQGIKFNPQLQPTPQLWQNQHWNFKPLCQARDWTHTTAATWATAETMPDL